MTKAAGRTTQIYTVGVKQYRDALRDAVELPITTRGVLYVLAQWMNVDGTNAYPRLERLAASCQLRRRALANHLSTAVQAGYLHRTSEGHKGSTAVYRASIPQYRWDDEAHQLIHFVLDQAPEPSNVVSLRVPNRLVWKRINGGGALAISTRDWYRMLLAYRHCCAYCGARTKLQVEHVIPLSRGGRHSIGNVVPACGPCNMSKSDRLLVEWKLNIRPKRRRRCGGSGDV
jgi:5-methylcytosine-specific restriction endonuclease McrA